MCACAWSVCLLFVTEQKRSRWVCGVAGEKKVGEGGMIIIMISRGRHGETAGRLWCRFVSCRGQGPSLSRYASAIRLCHFPHHLPSPPRLHGIPLSPPSSDRPRIAGKGVRVKEPFNPNPHVDKPTPFRWSLLLSTHVLN